MSAPLSILHVGEALKQAKAMGKSDETYEVRLFWPAFMVYDVFEALAK